MNDEKRGIYRKYHVERTDGSSGPGGKHEHCTYFVLDLKHDPYAIPALKAYARACRKTHPQLAAGLMNVATAKPTQPTRCACREAMCPHVRPSLGDSPNEAMQARLEITDQIDGEGRGRIDP